MDNGVVDSSSHGLMARLVDLGHDIKLSHSVFALPYALLAMVLAGMETGRGLTVNKVLLILACMVTARTVAMGVNRVMDASLDALNPRTRRRAIPAGRISRPFYITVIAACGVAFIAATAGFWVLYHNPWPLIFSVPVLAYLSAYPLLKRFTQLCHYYLGAALGLSPVGAWIAVTGRIDVTPVWIAAVVMLWTAGFDIIYACQDYDSDLQTHTFSVPARLGIARALWVSRLTHLVCAALLVGLGWWSPNLGRLYMVGAGLAVILLIVEQSMVRADDLSRAGLAFFTMNGMISLLLGTLGIISALS